MTCRSRRTRYAGQSREGMRRTKIIATLGPATDKPGVLEKMLRVGTDLFRLNYSHQEQKDHSRRIRAIRELSARIGIEVGIVADLQGPRIRLQRFTGNGVYLEEGASFTLDPNLDARAGDTRHVGVTYKNLPREVKPGSTLLVDDGRIVLEVSDVSGHEIRCKVLRGGELTSSKGVNVPGGGLSLDALTEKDRRDLHHGVKLGVDYFAVSFPRRGEDVRAVRHLLREAGSEAGLIAKFECAEALERASEIVREADAVMIARGDLGVEIGDANLPAAQKRLVRLAREMDRASITATQMMQSMIDHEIPLRAEIFDVANAVLDGTDAIMLSSETSIGMFPAQVVTTAGRVCAEAEKQRRARTSDHRIDQRFENIDESIAMAAMYTANHAGVKAIAAITETGATCLWMSRISSGLPIFAFTRHLSTRRKVRLYRGVYPIAFDITHVDPQVVYGEVMNELRKRDIVAPGDLVLVTRGDLRGERGGTNTMKLLRVPENGR